MIDLICDPEFEKFLAPASEDDDKTLEELVLASDGPRDPICVWAGHRIIIDGYRRYKICVKHSLPFQVREIDLPDRGAVRVWMARQQMGRRNLSTHDRDLLIATIAESYGVPIIMVDPVAPNLSPHTRGSHEAAEDLGINYRTLRRAINYAAAYRSLPEETQQLVIENKPSRQEVIRIAAEGQAAADLANDDSRAPAEPVEESVERDTVSRSEPGYPAPPKKAPAKKVPPVKSVKSRFAEVYDTLGRVKHLLDGMGADYKGPYYGRAMRFLDQADDEIAAWEKAET